MPLLGHLPPILWQYCNLRSICLLNQQLWDLKIWTRKFYSLGKPNFLIDGYYLILVMQCPRERISTITCSVLIRRLMLKPTCILVLSITPYIQNGYDRIYSTYWKVNVGNLASRLTLIWQAYESPSVFQLIFGKILLPLSSAGSLKPKAFCLASRVLWNIG